MEDYLTILLSTHKISRIDYLIYILFSLNDSGKDLLNCFKQSVLTEEAFQPTEDSFAWKDGRRSWVKDLIITLDKVDSLIEEVRHNV